MIPTTTQRLTLDFTVSDKWSKSRTIVSVAPCLAFLVETSLPPTESKRVLSLFRSNKTTSSLSWLILSLEMARTVLGSGAGRRLDQSFRPPMIHLTVGLVSFDTGKHIPAQQTIAGAAHVFSFFVFLVFWVYLTEEDSPFWFISQRRIPKLFSSFLCFYCFLRWRAKIAFLGGRVYPSPLRRD